jgi:hypothetical protein
MRIACNKIDVLLKGEKMNEYKPIIDVCCGSKMFWFRKDNRVCHKTE